MNINGKNILIFPEYHLTDFPPQVPLAKKEAYNILDGYKNFGFDVLISGYVEKDNNENYSSCLIIDGENTYNVRKKHVDEDEQKVINPCVEKKEPIELSIGRTLIIICVEFKSLIESEYTNIDKQGNIENLLLISAMFHKFEENTEKCLNYCKDYKIKRFITSDRFFGTKMNEILKISG
jgi:predicted amidohydrolase